MLHKYTTLKVLGARMGAIPAGTGDAFRKSAKRWTPTYEARPGYLYVRSRAISSRTNDNFDTFPGAEIAKAYRTFIGKPVFVNHHNADHRRSRGVIIDAFLHEDIAPDGSEDTWAEVLMEIDAITFPKLAKAIIKGRIDRTSMGTSVGLSECSFCGNKATSVVEFCKHIPAMKGQRITRIDPETGARRSVLVHEICYDLTFFENSLLVEDPADPTAYAWIDSTDGIANHEATVAMLATASKDPRFKGVSVDQDDDGYYVKTHRARSKSYPSEEAIPDSVVAEIERTGSRWPEMPRTASLERTAAALTPAQIERIQDTRDYCVQTGNTNFMGGPSCGYTTEIISEEDPTFEQVWGAFRRADGGQPEHVWLTMADGTIVDPTADQFGHEPIRVLRPGDPGYADYLAGAAGDDLRTAGEMSRTAKALPEGITLRVDTYEPVMPRVRAELPNGTLVGTLSWFAGTGEGNGEVFNVWVSEDYRRKGIATAMWVKAKERQPNLHHSTDLSEDGRAWSQTVASVVDLDRFEWGIEPQTVAMSADGRAWAQKVASPRMDVVDFKAERPLSGAEAVRIDSIIPGSRTVLYNDMPFLAALEAMEGLGDITDPREYTKARDALFAPIPPSRVPFSSMVLTQPNVNMTRVTQIVDDPSTGGTKPLLMVRHRGELYVVNGHHRLAADYLRGESGIMARVMDIDETLRTGSLRTEASIGYYMNEQRIMDRLGRDHDLLRPQPASVLEALVQKVVNDDMLPLRVRLELIDGDWSETLPPDWDRGEVLVRISRQPQNRHKWTALHEAAHVLAYARGTEEFENENHGEEWKGIFYAEVLPRHGYSGGYTASVRTAARVQVETYPALDKARLESTASDYWTSHRPSGPQDDVGAPLHDVEMVMPDYYTRPNLYSHDRGQVDRECERVIQAAKGDPDHRVTIYRALPPGITTINPGDWVTISEAYARGHAMQSDDPAEDWPVISAQARAGDLWTEGYAAEWGYWGPAVNARLATLHTAALKTASRVRPGWRQMTATIPEGYYLVPFVAEAQTDEGLLVYQIQIRVGGPSGEVAGTFSWYDGIDPDFYGAFRGEGEIADVTVFEPHRRKGIATAMLAAARSIDPKVHHSTDLSPDGRAWRDAVGAVHTAAVIDPALAGQITWKKTDGWAGHRLYAYLDDRQIGAIDWDNEARITDIEVKPDMRNKGLGSELYRRAKEIEPGLEHAGPFSDEGLAFARSHGFTGEVYYDADGEYGAAWGYPWVEQSVVDDLRAMSAHTFGALR